LGDVSSSSPSSSAYSASLSTTSSKESTGHEGYYDDDEDEQTPLQLEVSEEIREEDEDDEDDEESYDVDQTDFQSQSCDNNNKNKQKKNRVKTVEVSFDTTQEEDQQQNRDEGGRNNRTLLTSDYDSSNESPCDAQVTVTDVDIYNYVKGPCLLCGRKRTRASLESIHRRSSYPSSLESTARKACWPNTDAPPPLNHRLDSFGRFVVKDGQIYDLDELAVDPLLNLITEWDYPIFDLRDASGDAILSEMSYRIFYETGLLEAFKIPLQEFLNFFRALECGYKEKPCE
jgi:hypothetical protein